jgi:RHS repeat-associated protein
MQVFQVKLLVFFKKGVSLSCNSDTTTYTRIVAQRRYEISNHLGNVLATVLDRKTTTAATGTVIAATPTDANLFRADIATATDYYAFGQPMPTRDYKATWSSTDYRYGFQGQEQEDELWKNAAVYKYRIEDCRIGRFFSVDPLDDEYPFYSPYAFSGNRLMDAVELEGLEPKFLKGLMEYSLIPLGGYIEKRGAYLTKKVTVATIGASVERRQNVRGVNVYVKATAERTSTGTGNVGTRVKGEVGLRDDGDIRVNGKGLDPAKPPPTKLDGRNLFDPVANSTEVKLFVTVSTKPTELKDGLTVGPTASLTTTTKIPLSIKYGLYYTNDPVGQKHEIGVFYNTNPTEVLFQQGATFKTGFKAEYNKKPHPMVNLQTALSF